MAGGETERVTEGGREGQEREGVRGEGGREGRKGEEGRGKEGRREREERRRGWSGRGREGMERSGVTVRRVFSSAHSLSHPESCMCSHP